MGKPAARVGDPHVCPMFDGPKPHVGGPVLPPGKPTVLIGGMSAATVGTMCFCVGPPDTIIQGSMAVFISGMPAARLGDMTAHGGRIVFGDLTVLIGDYGIGPADLDALQGIADSVNPLNSDVNCGNIIDAVVARLSGTNPAATAPAERDGTFPEIDQRFNTTIQWGHTFDQAFTTIRNGGPGTTAIIGIDYRNGSSHIVTMTNRNGTVGIVEGQDWGPDSGREVITDPQRARERYGDNSNVGIGVLPGTP